MVNETLTSILFFYTEASRKDNSGFSEVLNELQNKNKYNLTVCESYMDVTELLSSNHDFNVVLIHIHSSDPKDLWRDTYYQTRTHNKFTEVIVTVVDNDVDDKINAGEVLRSGCFAFFQYTFAPEVLFGYIEAARQRCEERQIRAELSRELSKGIPTVNEVGKKIAQQLKKVAKEFEYITIVLLKDSERNEHGFLRKLVYTNRNKNQINWDLLNPTNQDPLIKSILNGDIKRQVFPNPRQDEEIKDLIRIYNDKLNSLIVLPLKRADEFIGLITIESSSENFFSYDKINEVTLEQIANQAATAILYAERDEVHEQLSKALNVLNSSSTLDEILKKLAEQACRLVGGLFSYIVIPNQERTELEFRGAWSQHHEEGYIDELNKIVRFPRLSNDGKTEKSGITTLAYQTGEVQLLEYITNENYQEASIEARRAYLPIPYIPKNNNHQILPNSDIALPILLKSDRVPSDNSKEKIVLGVINVEHEDPFAFTKEQILALEQLANFAAVAIRNRAKQRFIGRLYDLIDLPYQDDLSFEKSLDSMKEFLSNIADNVKEVCRAELVTVHMIKDNKSFLVGHSKSFNKISDNARWGNDETMGHTFWAVKNKKPVIIEDAKSYNEDPGKYEDIYGETYIRRDKSPIIVNENTNKEYNTLICIPMIISEQKVVGAMWMYFRANPEYSIEEIEWLEKFAGNVANIINVIEKVTFLQIEHEIENSVNKKQILNNIIKSAQLYFGLRGVAIYEANHTTKKLSIAESSIKINARDKISFAEESVKGLSGNLMLGINKGNYDYEKGYFHVENYKDYVDGMDYTENEKEELGSMIGIRFPFNSKPSQAKGVLIVTDQIVIPGYGGRKYEKETIDDLIRFADIIGKCLKSLDNDKKETLVLNKDFQQELQTNLYELKKSLEQKHLELASLEKEKDKIQSEQLQIEKRYENTKKLLFCILLILSFYPIWLTDIFAYIIPSNQLLFGKIAFHITLITILIFYFWGYKIFKNRIWQNTAIYNALMAVLAFITILLTVLSLLLDYLKTQ